VERSGSKGSFRGTYTAKIDDKGRLKIPTAFRSVLEAEHGVEVFVTSLTGEEVLIYPMPVWLALEEKLGQMPSTHPSRLKFAQRVNYFGQPAEVDAQGRVIIHGRLRESAAMSGDVDVVGEINHLAVWNSDRLQAKMLREPFTLDDNRELSQFGI
jgi:MraZ protein